MDDKTMKTLFSSASVEWETPIDMFKKLDDEFHFTLDVCATRENRKCMKFFSLEDDGLRRDWSKDRCWMNPPYGRGTIEKWMKKAYEESLVGAIVVCLIPARTDAKWFHKYVLKAKEMWILDWRVRFLMGGERSKQPSSFPSLVVVFDGNRKAGDGLPKLRVLSKNELKVKII